MELTAIILAGGLSSRMGTDKGLLQVGNAKLIDYVIANVKPSCSLIKIIANNSLYNHYPYPVYPDIYEKKGPVGGIFTGLQNSSTDYCLIAGCDLPYATNNLIEYLIDNVKQGLDAVIPTIYNQPQPLFGIYSKHCGVRLEDFISKGKLTMRDILSEMNTKYVDIHPGLDFYHPDLFMNINYPDELDRLINNQTQIS